MRFDRETVASRLLVQWHKWAGTTVRTRDTQMMDLDVLISALKPPACTALRFHARNLSCGAKVWNSPRVSKGALQDAMRQLLCALNTEPARWFGLIELHLNARGNRIGESNPMAVLTDHEVELLLQMRLEQNEDGTPMYSYSWLAEKFEIGRTTVQDICNGRRRGQTVAKIRKVAR